jgi:hypothetical protein
MGYVKNDQSFAVVFRYELGSTHRIFEMVRKPDGTWNSAVDLSVAAGGVNEPEATMADPIPFVSTEGRDTIVYRGISQTTYQLERNPATGAWTRTKLNN